MRFWRGSPIPMKTTFETWAASRSAAVAASVTWSTISSSVRLRPAPSCAVAQNLHPSAQPTWLDTHTVRRPRACAMDTVSIRAPSPARSAHFTVPSREAALASGTTAHRSSDSPTSSRSALGQLVTPSQSDAPRRFASAACRPR